MHTRTKLIITGVALTLALGTTAAIAGPMIYRDLIVGPPAAAPTMDLGTLRPSNLSGDQLTGTWTAADGSYAGYRVKEVLNGTDVTVTGRTNTITASVTTSSSSVTKAEVSLDVASITTPEAARDEYFRTTAIDTSKQPKAIFALDTPVSIDTSELNNAQTVKAKGSLEINGVTKPVTVTIATGLDGDTAVLAGSIPITFKDFGVTAPDLGFVKVEQKGSVEFSLRLQRS